MADTGSYGVSELRTLFPLWEQGDAFPDLRAEMERRIVAAMGIPPALLGSPAPRTLAQQERTLLPPLERKRA